LRNCFSESPWRGSDRQVESDKRLHTYTLDINRWPSLGLGVDPATPRLSSESLESKEVCSEPCVSMAGVSFCRLSDSPYPFLTRQH